MKTKEISIADIDYSRTQMRARIDENHVAELAEVLADGGTLPPVRVMYDGVTHHLVDGFHRLHAHRKAGLGEITATVEKGTQRDAILASCGVNSDHGLKRTNEDKRKAVLTLLEDAEWSKMTDREVAVACHVSQPFVLKLRHQLITLSTEEASKRTGKDGKKYKAKKPKKANQEAGKPAEDPARLPGSDGKVSHGNSFDVDEIERATEHDKAEEATAAAVAAGLIDELGLPIPAKFAEQIATSAKISALRNQLAGIKRELNNLREMPGGEHLPQSLKLDELDASLRFARYMTACPMCEAEGCHSCRQNGWLRHGVQMSQAMKDKLVLAGVDLKKIGG